MNISEPFIRRPVATSLLAIAMLLLGTLGYLGLPVNNLPTVDFPTIQVTANLAGANPETMASSVASPLERQFTTIAGLDAMSSSSSLGQTQITLQFNLDRDIDSAAQDVQSAIAAAGRQLPTGMTAPPNFRKVNPAEQAIIMLAISSPSMPLSQLNEYAETMIAQRLSTVSGVSQINIWGSQKYAVRAQMDPQLLAARGIGIEEVESAIKRGNSNVPAGTLNGPFAAFDVQAKGQLEDADAYRRLIVSYKGGVPVRLGDLGRIVDSVENTRSAAWFNRVRGVIVAVQRQPGSNTIAVVDGIHTLLPELRKAVPASVNVDVLYDRSRTIRESVNDVQFTLVLTMVLVVLVIFLFLRNLTATVIPSLALPTSIVATFGLMAFLEFSLNNLSLMALTLATGFVVDDAIVMLENIVRHMEMGKSRMEAALEGSREIAFTIVAMTISLVAVFIPVLFMGGIVGRLFNEFAVTISAAILISGFVSLTLTPMMGGRFLKQEHSHGVVYDFFERGFISLLQLYERTLKAVLKARRLALAGFVVMAIVTGWLFTVVPKGFLPTEDVGPVTVNHLGQLPAVTLSFNLAPGVSLDEATTQIEAAAKEVLPEGLSVAFQGSAQVFQESTKNMGLLLGLSLVVIYLVLGILYESFIHPLTVLAGLPSAGFGALATLLLFNRELDIYGFVGLIMLIGIVKKNAIILIDFAIDAEKQGKAPADAIYEACIVRFRPIMMTTAAALMGTLPLALGMGAGGEARQGLGLAVVGGLLVSQMLTLYITPVVYLYMDRLRGKRDAGAGMTAPCDTSSPSLAPST